MDKRKSIVDYYNANQAYFDYLQGIFEVIVLVIVKIFSMMEIFMEQRLDVCLTYY